MEDKVNHPSHYTWLKEICGVEVIDITRHLDFDCGNAIKYILRAGHKSEEGYDNRDKMIEDLKKAIFYLEDKVCLLEDRRHTNELAEVKNQLKEALNSVAMYREKVRAQEDYVRSKEVGKISIWNTELQKLIKAYNESEKPVEYMEMYQSYSSGIGPATDVFLYFPDETNKKVDITDVSKW